MGPEPGLEPPERGAPGHLGHAHSHLPDPAVLSHTPETVLRTTHPPSFRGRDPHTTCAPETLQGAGPAAPQGYLVLSSGPATGTDCTGNVGAVLWVLGTILPALAQKPHPSPRSSPFSKPPPTRHGQTSAPAHPSLAPRAALGLVEARFLPEAAPVLELFLPSRAQTPGSIPSTTRPFQPGPSRPCSTLSPPHPALSAWPAGVLSPRQPRCVPQPLHPTAGFPHPGQHTLLSPLTAGPSTALLCTGGALALHQPRPTAIPRSRDRPRPRPSTASTLSFWPCCLLCGPPHVRHPASLACSSWPLVSQHLRPQRSHSAPNLYHVTLNSCFQPRT